MQVQFNTVITEVNSDDLRCWINQTLDLQAWFFCAKQFADGAVIHLIRFYFIWREEKKKVCLTSASDKVTHQLVVKFYFLRLKQGSNLVKSCLNKNTGRLRVTQWSLSTVERLLWKMMHVFACVIVFSFSKISHKPLFYETFRK